MVTSQVCNSIGETHIGSAGMDLVGPAAIGAFMSMLTFSPLVTTQSAAGSESARHGTTPDRLALRDVIKV